MPKIVRYHHLSDPRRTKDTHPVENWKYKFRIHLHAQISTGKWQVYVQEGLSAISFAQKPNVISNSVPGAPFCAARDRWQTCRYHRNAYIRFSNLHLSAFLGACDQGHHGPAKLPFRRRSARKRNVDNATTQANGTNNNNNKIRRTKIQSQFNFVFLQYFVGASALCFLCFLCCSFHFDTARRSNGGSASFTASITNKYSSFPFVQDRSEGTPYSLHSIVYMHLCMCKAPTFSLPLFVYFFRSSVCFFLVIEHGKDSKHGWCSCSSLCANNPY